MGDFEIRDLEIRFGARISILWYLGTERALGLHPTAETHALMPLEVARHAVGSRTLIRVRLLDRRLPRPVEDDFLFQHDVELCLYGSNNGALYQLMARCVWSHAPRPLHA